MSEAEDTTPTPIPRDDSSGTVASQADSAQIDSRNSVYTENELSQVPTTKPRAGGDEEALESHQVIELQIFSERKAWIEDKIKILEQMPPIQVFLGLDAVQSSAEEVPGLPTREELRKWIMEHDVVEKETEGFDTGELKKLRNFTRAATQRNLSPEDTDLIELTLTTIYALDKLLHLLRDRSETLDLLGVRLAWEEHRISSWVDRRKIIADLQTFLESRAQWSPSVYDNPPKADPAFDDDHRRGSVSSLASVASDTSITSPAFSRSTRFRLAETLSRDAATFSARVSSLRHGSVAASGKSLDKLIDNSRKPVPEVLLDEQDRVEDKCVNDLEHIGKFVLNVVMQWRKADEIYVETMKDQFASQTLREEIEGAMMQYPTARQSSAFITRSEALSKRLRLRGDPASSNSTFPRPTHPLFPQQSVFNESLTQTLSFEIKTTTELVRNVESLAMKYRVSYDAVSRVETLNEAVSALTVVFESILARLENGISSSEGDGTPPTLMSSDCLDPGRHSVFIALLPSLLDELARADQAASDLVRQVPAALLHVDFPGVDQEFKSNASAKLLGLIALRERAQRENEVVVGRMGRLREARRIWSVMDMVLRDLEVVRCEVADEMDRRRWRQVTTSVNGAPLTPESPSAVPLPTHSFQRYIEQLELQMSQLGARMDKGVDDPLASLLETLETPLKEHLSHSARNLKSHFARVKRIIDLLQSIHKQTSTMDVIREEFNALQLRIDDVIIRYESKTEDVLGNKSVDEQVVSDTDTDEAMSSDFSAARSDAMVFVNSLAQRVPLVGSLSQVPSVRRSFSMIDLASATHASSEFTIELPFDLHAIDDAVRADCNSYTMRLNGQVHNLEQKSDIYHLSHIAKELDASTSVLLTEVDHAFVQISTLRDTFDRLGATESLEKLVFDIDQASSTHRSRLNRSLSITREIRRRLESAPGILDSNVHERVLLPRTKGIGELESRITSWEASIESLRARVVAAQEAEVLRLKQEKDAEEACLAAERDRIAREEAERAQLEKARQEKEERQRLEEARLAEEARLRQEEEERAISQKEQREEAERIKLNEIRLAEEARAKAEQKKLALEEAEKARLDKERLEMAVKLKETEERLFVERQLHAERERLAQEEAQYARLEREKLDQERKLAVKELEAANISLEEDVFGVRITPAEGHSSMSSQTKEVLTVMARLRKRLRSIGVNEAARPQSRNSVLPRAERARAMRQELLALQQEVHSLPDTVEVVSINVQLKSLRHDIESSLTLMDRVDHLAALCEALSTCDYALSDLLEHIDSFPAIPMGILSSSYTSPSSLTPEEQLGDRLSFTKSTIGAMTSAFEVVKDDRRAIVENERILQTWSELEEMGNDRVHGRKSRPSSVMSTQSSGHSSRISPFKPQPSPATSAKTRKSSGYANLSVSSSTPRGRLNVPSPSPSQRRAFSGSDEPSTRSTSRMSTRSSQPRAISGGSLYGTTFASRQRTTSLTPVTATPPPKRNFSNGHTRSQTSTTSQKKRDPSPSLSDASLSHNGRSSTWSRAPRISFSGVPRASTPQKRPPASRKTYVANPKSKLDVAVGDVVNSLPIGINIEGVSGSWKDQSGKYWIGDQEPKLCFCRILRSQTVMVRVGGGWSELSKFIRDHFADSFRLLAAPDSPGMHVSGEERWISSATLLEEHEQNTPPGPPKTPEPKGPLLPSFALSTPSGRSPQSLMSTPSTKGSPLTPLQFLRRAEPEAPFFARPETPTKSPSRPRTNTAHTPSRQSIWRP